MDMGEYLRRIADGYTVTEKLRSEGHRLLALAPEVIKPLIPAGLLVKSSGGQGTPTFTPWIAIFDPDETRSPQRGIYLVWIFSNDRSKVVLTLNQGITDLQNRLRSWPACLPLLQAEAQRIRNELTDIDGLATVVNFGTEKRQRGYGAANIVARTYMLSNLPPEKDLVADLRRMIDLYQRATLVKRGLPKTQPDITMTGSPAPRKEPGELAEGFSPKDRADYLVEMAAVSQMRRGDRHELLISEYAGIAKKLGHKPRNKKVHPRDLTLTVSGNEWLVEAKVVYNGNAAQAVRAAIGQLLEYSTLLYVPPKPRPRLMALFTQPIGPVYVGLLESLNIAVVWKGAVGWEASSLASELI